MNKILILTLAGLSWQLAAAELNLNPDAVCAPILVVDTVRDTSLSDLAERAHCVSQPVLEVDDANAASRFVARRLVAIAPNLLGETGRFEDGVSAYGELIFLPVRSATRAVLPSLVECPFCKSSVSVGDQIEVDGSSYAVAALYANSQSRIIAKLADAAANSSFMEISFKQVSDYPVSRPIAAPAAPASEAVINYNPIFHWFTAKRWVGSAAAGDAHFESGEGFPRARDVFHAMPAISASVLSRVEMPWDLEVLSPGDALTVDGVRFRVLKLYVNGTEDAVAAQVLNEETREISFKSLSDEDVVYTGSRRTEAPAKAVMESSAGLRDMSPAMFPLMPM